MPAMVELRNISKSFGAFPALGDISLEIAEGEFMTLLGPRAAGKQRVCD
jgi:ABC-type spermidine/putrescine transport systems, ATPase components